MPGGKLYVIWDAALTQSGYRNKNFSFLPFATEFANREVSLTHKYAQILRKSNFVPEYFESIHSSMTGNHLLRMNTHALEFIAGRLKNVGAGGEALVLPNFYIWVRDFMTAATTEALFGSNNPFLAEPGLLEDIWWGDLKVHIDIPTANSALPRTIDSHIFRLLMDFVPSITASAPYYARRRIQAALARYYGAEHYEHSSASQMVKNRVKVMEDYSFPTDEKGRLELSLILVATANTIPTVFWFLSHIFTRPDLVERVRAEVAPVAQRTGDRVSINITTLEQSCPLLVSCYREAIRLTNQQVGNRRLTEDTFISDGKGNSYLLKKGVNVQMPAEALHLNQAAWGPDAAVFNPDRFIFTSARAVRSHFVPFGGGRHYCPGRNFAMAENLSFAAAMLLGFEITLEGRIPEVQPCTFAEAVSKPVNQGAGLRGRVQRRKGWERVSWEFSAQQA